MSVSIDPDNDTPARLREYAKRFSAGPQWNHYTGTLAASVALQKAFNAYRGDKMNHQPTTYLRAAPGKPWVRLDGFYGPTALIDEYQRALQANLFDVGGSDAARTFQASFPTAATSAGTTTKSTP